MTVGTIGGIATGISVPVFNALLGRLLDNLNTDPGRFRKSALDDSAKHIASAGSITDKINTAALQLTVLGCINIASGFTQVLSTRYHLSWLGLKSLHG